MYCVVMLGLNKYAINILVILYLLLISVKNTNIVAVGKKQHQNKRIIDVNHYYL